MITNKDSISKFSNSVSIGQRIIGKNLPTYFIADIGANHDGDINRAKDLICLAKEMGAVAAKFQHFKASTIVNDKGFKNLKGLKSHQSSWDKSVYEVYEDASIELAWTEELKKTCVENDIEFLTSPYDIDLLYKLNTFINAVKIGSGDITWHHLLREASQLQKPILLATGASNLDEVVKAVEVIQEHSSEIILMQCNTNYTGSKDNFKYINLNVLKTYSLLFPDLILGLSDHTPGHSTVLGAISLGACVIEKHFTDSKERIGPDHAFALDPSEWKEMVERSKELELALGLPHKNVETNETQTVILQRRSLYYKSSISKGSIISDTDLIPLRPAPEGSLKPHESHLAVGRTLKTDVEINQLVSIDDYE